MTSTGVTDAERRGWQRRAARTLDTLLAADLPPLTWTVDPTATLVGRVYGPDDTRRARWQAWVTALAATTVPDQVIDAVTYLRATVPDRRDWLVHIVVLATVLDPEPQGGDLSCRS